MKICQLFQSVSATTEGNILYVEFYSDDMGVNLGFELTYEQKESKY